MSRSVSTPLYAAAGRVELVPPAGGRLGGFGCRFEAQAGSLDTLFARLVLFEQDGLRVLWVSCDLLGFSTSYDREFRRQIGEVTAIPATNILISCTHTHSAPVAMPARGPSGIADEHWLKTVVFGRVAAAAIGLISELRPVAEIEAGSQSVPGLGYNRQDANCPIDENVYCVAFLDSARRVIATIVNYALHPVVIGETNLKCSADFPGYVCSTVEQQLGSVALFINGSCGDVDPVIYRDEGRGAGTVDTIRTIGRTIAHAALQSLRSTQSAVFKMSIRHARVTIPLDAPDPERAILKLRDEFAVQRGTEFPVPRNPAARGAMYQLAWAEDLLAAKKRNAVPKSLDAQLVSLRIGPMHVVTFPFEIYSEIGLELRKRLAPRNLIIAAYTGGLFGYVVTTLAKEQGGYGAALSHRYFPELLTPIGIGADQILTEAGVALAIAADSKKDN